MTMVWAADEKKVTLTETLTMTLETPAWNAAWEYCGDEPGEPLIVPEDFKVLEVGSGHAPWPRANFNVDIDDVRESLPFEKQDNFLQADAHALPEDWTGKFDYVLASHILACRGVNHV